jgi:PAS domain S-box-containing protein
MTVKKITKEQMIKEIIEQGFFEYIGDGVSIQDLDYRILYQNQRSKDMIGDHVGEYCYRAYEHKDAVCEECPVQLTFKDGEVHTSERTTTTESGLRHFEITASPIRGSTGKIIAGIEVVRDFTEHKKEKQALQYSEKQLRKFVDKAPIGIYKTNLKGEILFINDMLVKMFEFESKEEMMSRDVSSAYKNPKDRDFLIKQLKNKGYIQNFALETVTKTGKEMHILLSASLDGDILSGMIMDVTHHKIAERELMKSEERFRMLAEQSPSMIFINKKGKVLYVNKKCEEIMGYTKEEFLSDDFNFMVLIAPSYWDLVRENYKKHTSGKDITPQEYKLITKDGRELIAIHSTKLIYYDGEPVILGVITDITERKRIENALMESEKRLMIQTQELLEANTALKVLLKQREKDKQEIEANIFSNVKNLIYPYINKLKQNKSMKDELVYLNILEANLNEIISSFSYRLSSGGISLTPKEIKIANLVKEGKQDKEIMEILNISLETVKTHRQNIRKKLGIYNKRTNLRTYLLSLSE